MTAALEGGDGSAARPGRTLPPGKTRYPLYRRLGGPQGRSRRAENLDPTGIRSRTVQPVASRYTDFFSPLSARASGGPQLPRYRGFMITLKHNTLGRTTLDELSFRRRDLYLTIHNTHKRHTCTLPAGFEPVTPASKRPQTHALDCAGTASYYRC